MTDVRWYTNDEVGEALDDARRSKRPLFVDFWSPTCKGCAKLFVDAYSDERVREFLAETFVSVKYDTSRPNEWFRKLNGAYAHCWHPDLVVYDHLLHEAKRSFGFLPPAALIAHLRVGVGLVRLYHAEPASALEAFDRVIADAATADVVAEALYWSGVAAMRAGGGMDALAERWARLAERHPSSDWTLRADCLDVAIPEGGFRFGDPSTVTRRAVSSTRARDPVAAAR